MAEIHYALDAQGNYQVAPGDTDLAKEQGLPENFPASEQATVSGWCDDKHLQFVALPINVHEDVHGN